MDCSSRYCVEEKVVTVVVFCVVFNWKNLYFELYCDYVFMGSLASTVYSRPNWSSIPTLMFVEIPTLKFMPLQNYTTLEEG